jgi:hypothetical protein
MRKKERPGPTGVEGFFAVFLRVGLDLVCGGHVWQGRFKSPVIHDDEHLLTVL